jgi:hypothetical protein
LVAVQFYTENVIELSKSLLSEVPFPLPQYVSASALSTIEYATRVLVEPMTVEYWELLEIHAECMENRSLLQQVSVVYPNQILHLNIGKFDDRIRLIVKEVTSESTSSSSSSSSSSPSQPSTSVWPKLEESTSTASTRSLPCVLLVQDTEVVVSPKPRPAKKSIPWSSPLRLIPSDADWGDETLEILSTISNQEALAVEPGCIIVHNADHEWARVKPDKSNFKNQPERLIRVLSSEKVGKENAGMFQKRKRQSSRICHEIHLGWTLPLIFSFDDEK